MHKKKKKKFFLRISSVTKYHLSIGSLKNNKVSINYALSVSR